MNLNKIDFFALLVGLTYISSLATPGFYACRFGGYSLHECGSEIQTWYGLEILFVGWLGPINQNYAWYANILFLVSCLLSKFKPLLSMIGTLIGLYLASTATKMKDMWVDEHVPDIVQGWGIGYKLWLAAFILLFIYGLCQQLIKMKK